MKDKLEIIAKHYGFDAQSRQCIEEMAELTKSLNKFWRKNLLCGQVNLTDNVLKALKQTPEYSSVLEEVADVQIMIWQMESLLDLDINDMVDFKLTKTMERIEIECSN